MNDRKNRVQIHDDRVVKHFVRGHNRSRRLSREIEALGRLAGISGVPAVLEYSTSERFLVTERLPGVALADSKNVPDNVFIELRTLIEQMLHNGVARHSLPPRDVIVLPDDRPGLVDFERCTLRRWRLSPGWWIASEVTRFHLLRLIGNHAPHLLSEAEQGCLRRRLRMRSVLRRGMKFRQRIAPS